MDATHLQQTQPQNHGKQHSCTRELALCEHVSLDVTAHGWVPARHPRYTRAHHDGEAVSDSRAHGATRVRNVTIHNMVVE